MYFCTRNKENINGANSGASKTQINVLFNNRKKSHDLH